MKRLLMFVLIIAAAHSLSAKSDTPLPSFAMSTDARAANQAIFALRELGPRGVEMMVKSAPAAGSENSARYRAALDRVCQQRDCYASQLYWYTDLERAKRAAMESGKPILSLHLLGNLSEELSCANSRFFRTTLYSSPAIAKYMRENFVLHWRSVRPVPKITVDFGDGRRIRQTITGNSIHYILASDGQVIDALPGLYSPAAFLTQLQTVSVVANQYAKLKSVSALQRYHMVARRKLERELGEDLKLLRGNGSAKATAAEAARVTYSKIAVETNLLAAFELGRNPVTDPEWTRIAARRAQPVEFAGASLALMREKSGALDRALPNLKQTVAQDTVRNEYDLHRQIHEWLTFEASPALSDLNERVYAKLFLTPSSDPWLGLVDDQTFTAIKNAGIEMK